MPQLPQAEIEAICHKATSMGLDPTRDPVGAWLANTCSIWALLYEIAGDRVRQVSGGLHRCSVPWGRADQGFLEARHLCGFVVREAALDVVGDGTIHRAMGVGDTSREAEAIGD